MDKIKELLGLTKKEMETPAFLQGVIISCYTEIDTLKKENKQLRNKEGLWLAPERVEQIKKQLSNILDDTN